MSIETIIFLALLVVIVLIIVMNGVIVVPQSETRVIERLGRFHSVLNPGLNLILPFIDKAKTVYIRKVESGPYKRAIVRMYSTAVIDLREQVKVLSKPLTLSVSPAAKYWVWLLYSLTISLSPLKSSRKQA